MTPLQNAIPYIPDNQEVGATVKDCEAAESPYYVTALTLFGVGDLCCYQVTENQNNLLHGGFRDGGFHAIRAWAPLAEQIPKAPKIRNQG